MLQGIEITKRLLFSVELLSLNLGLSYVCIGGVAACRL